MRTFLLTILAVIFSHSLHAQISYRQLGAKELDDFNELYTTSLRQERSGQMTYFMSDDIRLMPEFQLTLMGKEQATRYFEAFVERFEIAGYARERAEIMNLGQQVCTLGTFTMRLKLRSTGKESLLQGKYCDFWTRKEDKWLLTTQAWNYDHPVDMAEQLKFREIPAVNVALAAHVPISDPLNMQLAAMNLLMERAIVEDDAALWSRFYADDVKWLYSFNPVIVGRQAMDNFLAHHVEEMPIFEKLDIRTDRIDVLEGYVVEFSSHIAITRDGDYSGVNTGKDVRVWRRGADGSLKILRSIAMYD